MPGLSTTKLALTNRMVHGNSRAARTAATGDWFIGVECTWLREVVEIPSPGMWSDVRDSLREHGVHGRQAALPVRIERSRDLQAEMVGTPMAGPTLDNDVESFVEPIPESPKRVIWP